MGGWISSVFSNMQRRVGIDIIGVAQVGNIIACKGSFIGTIRRRKGKTINRVKSRTFIVFANHSVSAIFGLNGRKVMT